MDKLIDTNIFWMLTDLTVKLKDIMLRIMEKENRF